MSVYQLPEGSSSWDQLNAHTVMDLREDPFWGFKQGTSSPSYAILIEAGVGFLRRSVNGGQTWSDITPATNPPNSGADSPIPTRTSVTYEVIDGSRITPNTHGVMVNWQNADSDWRSWLYHTTDDWVTGSWLYLGETPPCADNSASYSFSTTTEMFTSSTSDPIAQVSSDIFVFAYRDNGFGGDDYVQAFRVEVDDTVTVGARTLVSTQGAGPVTICRTATDDFAIGYAEQHNPSSSFDVAVGSVNTSTLAITLQTGQSLLTSDELVRITSGRASELRMVCPDGTNLVAIVGDMHPLDPGDSCDPVSTHGVHYLLGTVGATEVTWDDTTCGIYTVRDWQAVAAGFSTSFNARPQVLDCGNGTHFLYKYTDDNNDIFIGAGTSSGGPASATQVISSDADWYNLGHMANLTTTLAVFAYTYDDFADKSEIRGAILTRTGTSVSIGSSQTIYDTGVGSGLFAWLPWPVSVSSTQFIIRVEDIDPDGTCSSIFRCSVAAGVISVDDFCIKFNSIGAHRHWPIGYSTSVFVEPNNAGPAVYVHDVSFSCVPNNDAQGLGLSYGRGIGGSAWATICDGINLELIDIDISPLGINNRISLGAGTFAEVASKTRIAYPLIRWFNDVYVMVYGRMDNPQSLGDPAHLIYTTNGTTFLLNENGFGADHIGAMMEDGSNNLYVIRNTGGSPQLYEGTIVGSLSLTDTSTLTSDVSPHGIDLDWTDLTLVLASEDADAILVIAAASPYTSWTDLTSDHGDASSNGLVSVEVL